MQSIVIPRLEFRDATIGEALDSLHFKSVQLDPEKRGVDIVLNLSAPARLAGSPADAAVDPSTARVTISAVNVSFLEALKEVTLRAGLKYRVDDYAVEVVPLNAPEAMRLRAWPVDGKLKTALGNTPMEVLKARGIAFPTGAAVALSRDGTQLIMRNTAVNLASANTILDPEAEANKGAKPASQGPNAIIERKLANIILPKLEFRDATIREAIDFLKQKVVQLDPARDPAMRGTCILLKLEPTSPAAPESIPGLVASSDPGFPADAQASEPRINLSLTNVPLGEVFRYVCSLAGSST